MFQKKGGGYQDREMKKERGADTPFCTMISLTATQKSYPYM